ncbi:hypothetical protein [Clostridium algidicarnis]|uniref:Uncharacterized protein n=1 Tax=Clostridium algidicarnis DSM 15099 TaxID=1121295 RepID=A0A2S6G092_9CLOT|nr:hypothetical protein [Clostridium algidicarnis]MBB6630919.1 hypothetical protein [Clostridium algidicarnis]MBB6696824.1 hypothetical protein [Clostridium algidicarnis]MBU3206770.1 hypothetical protein [Clostridium algidicarnis]MCB2286123.1 hypothetical protein [Clostridium algidicarnis]PPK49156.1 hypothetical protein BD821_10269 [Clostridium algidicarnis DSM 15099]
MIFLVLGCYILICSSDLLYLKSNNLKKEILVYIAILSISVIISSLISLKVKIPNAMVYLGKVFSILKNMLGGFL